jgi:hypothetical protein
MHHDLQGMARQRRVLSVQVHLQVAVYHINFEIMPTKTKVQKTKTALKQCTLQSERPEK